MYIILKQMYYLKYDTLVLHHFWLLQFEIKSCQNLIIMSIQINIFPHSEYMSLMLQLNGKVVVLEIIAELWINYIVLPVLLYYFGIDLTCIWGNINWVAQARPCRHILMLWAKECSYSQYAYKTLDTPLSLFLLPYFFLSNSECFDLLQKSAIHRFHDTQWSSDHRGNLQTTEQHETSCKPEDDWRQRFNWEKQADNKSIYSKKLQRACWIMWALLYGKFPTPIANWI